MKELVITDKPVPDFDNPTEALGCLLILIRELCQAGIPKYQIESIFKDVQTQSREQGISEQTIRAVLIAALKERHSNPINAALDSMNGFW